MRCLLVLACSAFFVKAIDHQKLEKDQQCDCCACPGGCCPETWDGDYFCCPDNMFCAASADDCPEVVLCPDICTPSCCPEDWYGCCPGNSRFCAATALDCDKPHPPDGQMG